MSRYAYVIVQVAGFLINRNTLVIVNKCERDPRCAQDDKPLAVILSAAKDLERVEEVCRLGYIAC